jgi:GT2 family glycosyltransferase
MHNVKIITPYVDEQEIKTHKELFWQYDVAYARDDFGIGSDMMFQKMWNEYPDKDIFILHADMYPHEDNWLEKVLDYVNKYPEAGIFGCLLLYPVRVKQQYIIQSAGGKFSHDGTPEHFGSGFIVENNTKFKEHIELDEGQYDSVREVAWTTFGGCYIRRRVIQDVGGFSPDYEWTYNRDVDFCLTARQKNYKIYQIPVRLLHHESRDNKRIKAQDINKVNSERRNLEKLKTKWENSYFYKTLDTVIKNE